MEIEGWKVTTTGWNPDGDKWRRGFILTRSFEQYSGSFKGEKDEGAFEAFVRSRAALLD